MIDQGKILKYLEHFSVITAKATKAPSMKEWKPYQSEKISSEDLIYWVNKPQTKYFGLVTGFEDLECVDIDLKVFSTAKEKKNFWEEYIGFLRDNILDFDEKFSLYKTMNDGYHILYKSKRVEGNSDLAKLEGHKTCVIETRGRGGMVIAYPDNCANGKSYFDIDYVSDEDRSILFAISRSYNFIDEKPREPVKKKTQYSGTDLSPWEDFNQKTDIFDIIGDDFEIKHRLESAKKYVIKRHGASSVHSGYVFKDSMCAYIFSTGTIYPHETLITPFIAYAIKNHGGDYSKAASELYKQGFGSRLTKKLKEQSSEIIKPDLELDNGKLAFPVDIFPAPIKSYILECHDTLNSSVDYMGCSLLWLISVSIGNALQIEIVPGWKENSTVWISIVGKAGWGKTPSIKNIISPIQKLNAKKVKRYYKELEKFQYYDSLSAKEKKEHVEVQKPVKNQFIANDITLEALVDLHNESDNSVGVFKDELAGWMKDMNKYREGSDLEFWLSTWSGSPVILTRVTRTGSFIERPNIPVLGGIQPSILNKFSTPENKQNGFMDRMLLAYPEIKVKNLSKNRMDYNTISWYNDSIIGFYEIINSHVIERNDEGEIEPRICKMSDEAYKIYDKRYTEITKLENDKSVNEYLKSMMPKQKAYIARFALLIHVFNDFFEDGGNALEISAESMKKAIDLSNYFIETAKKIKLSASEMSEYERIININRNKSRKEQIQAIWKAEPDFNKTEVAEIMGVSRKTIYKYIKEFEKQV